MPAAMKKALVTKKPATRQPDAKVVVQNVNVPGYTHRVDATMYNAMRRAMLKTLPRKAPGMTQTEMWQSLARYAPKSLFPDSGKIGWWMKAVQLDLEAKKILVREQTKPLRWHKK
jgi:Family of unknown function (DUF6958)